MLFARLVARGAPTNPRAALQREGAAYISRFHGAAPMAISVPRPSLARFRAIPWIEVLEIDSGPPLRVDADLVPWGVDSIGADAVHANFNNRGTGVKVAFLDDGVNCSHPDLSGRLAGGYDFVSGSSSYCAGGSHGTPVAGIIAANADGAGVVGVAPEASLYSLRVCEGNSCDRGRIYDALSWAASSGMQVVTASIGDCGGNPPSVYTSLRLAQLWNSGVPVLFAGGNGVASGCSGNAPVSSYAAAANTIAVAAHSASGAYQEDYQYGPEIDISAPTNVPSTALGGGVHPSFGGTSAATPHVAGSLALLIGAGFSGSDLLLQRLTETAAAAGAPGKDNYYGWGLLRADDAAVPVGRVTGISWCTGSAITSAGGCSVTASVTNGIAPQVRFEVTYSNQPGVVTHYGWGAATRVISVPSGNYYLAVKAVPRDAVYLRVGHHGVQTIPVCTGNVQATNGDVVMNAPGGCGGSGDPL